jgi:hypothetical protein
MNFIKQTQIFLDSRQAGGSSENFTVNFESPLQLDSNKQYEIGLVSANIWYSWFNVNSSNNKFRYHNGSNWVDVAIPPGAYNVDDIASAIKSVVNGDYIIIRPNFNTLKCEIDLKSPYKIDFTIPNSIRSILGFESQILSQSGKHAGANRVNITEVNSILIRCSIVTDSYINGTSADCICSFSPDVPPGHLIHINPFQTLYTPINCTYSISQISMRVTDETGKEVDLNGERVTYLLHIRQCE